MKLWNILICFSIHFSTSLNLKNDDNSSGLSIDLSNHLDNILSQLTMEDRKKKINKKSKAKSFKFMQKNQNTPKNKTGTESCVNLANFDNNRTSDLLNKDATSSYFQESLISSLDSALTVITTEQDNEIKAEKIEKGFHSDLI